MKDIMTQLQEICDVFEKVEDKEDFKELLKDILSKKEIEAIYQRLEVAQMLKEGLTFQQIINEKHTISSTTIARVSKNIKNGAGYNKLFNKYNQ